VGAAVLTKAGEIFTGCNVENASFGLTVCAERNAIFKAVSEGYTDVEAIAIVADTDTLTPPCGACLQVMVEFNPKMTVVLANLDGTSQSFVLDKFIPIPFKF
jgi:cytidine deaminase